MRPTRSARRATLLALLVLSAAARAAGVPATAPASAPATPDERHAPVLRTLRMPPVSGLLVTQIIPLAPHTGLREGDIVTAYNDAPVATLPLLQDAIATFAAAAALEADDQQLLLDRLAAGEDPVRRASIAVRRGAETITLRVPPGGLGTRLRPVEAGVPASLNPAPSPRDQITIAWDDVPTIRPVAGQIRGDQTWLRIHNAAGELIAIEHRQLQPLGDSWTAKTRTWHIAQGKVADSESAEVTFAPGDHQARPALTLNSFTWQGLGWKVAAQRKGLTVQGTVESASASAPRPAEVREPTALGAVPASALPALAAALPRKEGLVLPLSVIREADLRTDTGYAMQAFGSKPLNQGPVKEAWAVRLWHAGTVVRTWWFDDQRRLVAATESTGETALRSANEDAAFKEVQK